MSTTTTNDESSAGAQSGKAANGQKQPNREVRAKRKQRAATAKTPTRTQRTPAAPPAMRISDAPIQQRTPAQVRSKPEPSSDLMLRLVEALPPLGSKMTQEKATVWLKAAEANLAFLYDLPGIQAAA
jgi:hypothetical protein